MESLKGTRDFFPERMRFRRWLEGRWRGVAEAYGYEEVDGPVLEPLDLYTRKSGDEIVRQLYRLTDRGRRELALRPEMTPSLARMLLGREASLPKPIRWYSIPRLFRYERPQRGRLREFFQLNMDLFGIAEEGADAELICAAADTLRAVGLADGEFRVRVNDRRLVEALLDAEGVAAGLRPAVLAAVDRLLRRAGTDPHEPLRESGLSGEEAEGLLSLFGRDTTEVVESYPESSPVRRAYLPLGRLGPLVEAGGAGPVVEFDLRIVRGLAYYTGIVFEIYATGGNLRAICGGGRYDDLLAGLGGGPLPAVGFGLGDAVLEELLAELGRVPPLQRRLDLYVITLRDEDHAEAIALSRRCRHAGLIVETGLRHQALVKQLDRATAAGASFAVVLGEAERPGLVTTRDLRRARSLTMRLEDLPDVLRRELTASDTTTEQPPGS